MVRASCSQQPTLGNGELVCVLDGVGDLVRQRDTAETATPRPPEKPACDHSYLLGADLYVPLYDLGCLTRLRSVGCRGVTHGTRERLYIGWIDVGIKKKPHTSINITCLHLWPVKGVEVNDEPTKGCIHPPRCVGMCMCMSKQDIGRGTELQMASFTVAMPRSCWVVSSNFERARRPLHLAGALWRGEAVLQQSWIKQRTKATHRLCQCGWVATTRLQHTCCVNTAAFVRQAAERVESRLELRHAAASLPG